MKIRGAPAFAAVLLSLNSLLAQSTMITISGVVKGAGPKGVSGIYFLAEGGYMAVTDTKGNYALSVPSGWSGRVTPLGDGIAYTPHS